MNHKQEDVDRLISKVIEFDQNLEINWNEVHVLLKPFITDPLDELKRTGIVISAMELKRLIENAHHSLGRTDAVLEACEKRAGEIWND